MADSPDDPLDRLGLDPMDGTAEQVESLDGYPNLKKYFTRFMETCGELEGGERLPELIVWIRTLVEPNDIDPAAFFGMDEEEAEDFYTWGHNSRWANAFLPHIEVNRNLALEKCLELARRFGDPATEGE